MRLFLRPQTVPARLAGPFSISPLPRRCPCLPACTALPQLHARALSGSSRRAAAGPGDEHRTTGDAVDEASTDSNVGDSVDDAPASTNGSAGQPDQDRDGASSSSSYTMTKILVAGRSNNEYTSSRTLVPTVPRVPPRVVPVPPNPAANEKFKFTLLRRSRRIRNTEAIITGGASGIGFAVAQRLAAEGVMCTLVGRNEERLKRAVESLSPLDSPPPTTTKTTTKTSKSHDATKPDADAADDADAPPRYHKYFLADVCDPKAWRDLFQQTPDANYLVNAAGITYRSLLAIFPTDEIQKVYDVNLYGTTIGCRAALRAWARSHKGYGPPSDQPDRCIVNVSSLLAVQGGYGAAAYAASKAGVVALTRALAQEAANRSVRCNVVLPGYIQTRMTESLLQAETIKKIAVKRMGRPDEVADAVAFLIKNKYANNCTLNLDGGTFQAA